MRNFCIAVCTALLTLTSCVNSGSLLPSVTGTSYEALVVMDNAYWNSAAGDSVRTYLAADMEAMPQIEPLFSLSHVDWQGFNDIMKPVRNMVLVDIDSTKYTQTKVYYLKNQWAKPQVLVRVCAPNGANAAEAIGKFGNNMAHYFVQQEIERQIDFLKTYTNAKAYTRLQEKFGIQLNVPNDMAQTTDKDDFFWITDTKGKVRRDIVVYSYPYTDASTFTKEFLLAKRDSVMKQYVSDDFQGSYMGTEYQHIPPIFKAIPVNGNEYCAEIRGLWKMLNGSAMGGPFVSHTRLDEMNQRVITVEGFVFGPGQKKRNALRQMEAVLYSLKLPQEINALSEVTATANATTEKE